MMRSSHAFQLVLLLLLGIGSVLSYPQEAVSAADLSVQDVRPSYKTASLNDRPIIGILAQETPKSLQKAFGNYTSYIATSYVKYWEAAGARVVPIMINRPLEYYQQLFSFLNGLVFPGGSAKLGDSGYYRAAKVLWDMAAEDPQDFFPIWGTCLGFELLTYLELNGRHLARCSSSNQALPLDFAPDGSTSRMFSGAGSFLLKIFAEQNVTINFHKYCVSPETYETTSLSTDYRLIATNKDWKGQEFVSAFEHKTRPVYGVQFHPEKNIFEWGDKKKINAIPHWTEAIHASQYLADFFISEVRKNGHRFPSVEEEKKHLIHQYKPEYSGNTASVFDQVYLFN